MENISYVKAGTELPRLSVEDMERVAQEYGLTHERETKSSPGSDSDAEKGHSVDHYDDSARVAA